jgi:hypothetical protein
MMTDISEMTAETFEPLIGETFTINSQPVTLKAVDKTDPASPKLRTQTSLVFTADEPIGMEDGIQNVAHPQLGEHGLLVHRVVDPDAPTYEIVLA